MSNKYYRHGFTLIELMVGMLAGSIILLIVGIILIGPYRSLERNEQYSSVRRSAAHAFAIMSRDIRSASYTGLLLEDGVLTLSANDVRAQSSAYTRNGGVLEYYVGGSKQQDLISKGLRDFQIALLDQDGVRGVEIYLEVENDDGSVSANHETFIHTRN